MKESIVKLAERLNGMKLDFLQLHTKIVEEVGSELTGDGYHVKLPVLSEKNSKIHQAAFTLTMKASFDSKNKPFLFYMADVRDDVYLIRNTNVLQIYNIPTLSLSRAVVRPARDGAGRNAYPYIEFENETEWLRLATQDVACLLATWYASIYIGR